MKRSVAPVLLLSVILISGGCKTAPPAASGRSSTSSAPYAEGYNRRYKDESRHRHRHGEGNQDEADLAPNDNWFSYDRRDVSTDRPVSSKDGNDKPGSRRRHHSLALTAAPGNFDFYVLNLSWSPEFCHSHPDAAECTQHRSFTLHGLWPQNNNGTYPEDCSNAPGPSVPSEYADIYPDPTLLQHEWQTHGTCSGLAPDAFFALARHADQSIIIPAALSHPTQQITETPAQLLDLFTQSNPGLHSSSLAISCGNNYLTAIEVCLDKDLKPESCSAVKSCGAAQIRIPAPQ